MKTHPFIPGLIESITATYPTPFHIYDENGIRQNVRQMLKTFSWANFTNYYAVKALPNPTILRLLRAEGMGADCSSLAELVLAENAGFKGDQIMFTSNDTTKQEFRKAVELGAVINLDDISHIASLEEVANALPQLLCFRFNPGAERLGNQLIGNPVEAKYGLTKEQIFDAYKLCKQKGVTRFGLHTMVASNELEASYFVETANVMFELAKEIKDQLDIEVEFINLGGGLGIPYHPEQDKLDLDYVSNETEKLYDTYFGGTTWRPKLFMECGRYVTGPHGYLVSTVLHMKHTYRDYVGLDASMADLMRPGMYGAYHHITVLGKENEPPAHIYDVTGSLCENNDKFAVQRPLPKIDEGDVVVVHDTGAHGHSMGFNYNGKLRSAELLLKPDSNVQLIRRAETLDDHFATLNV